MLRPVIIAVGLLCLPASIGHAESDCGPRPETPTLPSGATAQIEDMKAASDAIDAYADVMNAYADCLIEAAQKAIDERNAIVQKWNGEIDSFNQRLTSE